MFQPGHSGEEWRISAQVQLSQLYGAQLARAKISPQLARRLSCPLLMSILPGWEQTNERILIIGQETLGYGLKADEAVGIADHAIEHLDQLMALPNVAHAIELLMSSYAKSMSWPTPDSEYRPFWKAFAELSRPLGYAAVAWSNVYWFSLDGGAVWKDSTTWDEIEQIHLAQRGRLAKEIEVIKPTTTVFFTGPNYDHALRDEFPDIQFLRIGDYRPREFARLVSGALPEKSYRLYHPNYLQRSRQWQWVEAVRQMISTGVA